MIRIIKDGSAWVPFNKGFSSALNNHRIFDYAKNI